MLKKDFETLALKHLDSLYHFAVILTREEGHAKDLVQETFLRAHYFCDHYAKGTNGKAWLFTVMRNIFINEYQKRAKEISLSEWAADDDKNDPYEPLNSPLFSFDTPLGKGIFSADIEKAFNELPPHLKPVLILKDIEGFDYKEISQILGCPVGTVMSRLWRSRNFLKKRLKDYSEERFFRGVDGKQHENRAS